MRPDRISVPAVLLAVFGVLAGSGSMTTLLPVRARLEGFQDIDIGLMGSAYFGGMLAGAWLTPRAVYRFGHVRAFGLSSLLAAGSIAVLGLVVEPLAWIAIRGFTGFFLAGIYAIVESYLQRKAENRYRGRLLGIYSVVQYGGWSAGGQLIRLGDPAGFLLFGLAAAIVAVFLLPLLLAADDVPARGGPLPRLDLVWLYRTSPVAFVATVMIGFANGPFWTLTPLYATWTGMDAVGVGTLMTALTVGAALFQVPVGRLSDATDRRFVLASLTALTFAIEAVLYLAGPRLAGWPLIGIGVVLGGIVATQYYVVSALANDRTGRENAVGVAASLLFLYCVGAILGPITASSVMNGLGDAALFLHNGSVHVMLTVFVLLRLRRASTGAAGPAGKSPAGR